jgi:hypothetical protein
MIYYDTHCDCCDCRDLVEFLEPRYDWGYHHHVCTACHRELDRAEQRDRISARQSEEVKEHA